MKKDGGIRNWATRELGFLDSETLMHGKSQLKVSLRLRFPYDNAPTHFTWGSKMKVYSSKQTLSIVKLASNVNLSVGW